MNVSLKLFSGEIINYHAKSVPTAEKYPLATSKGGQFYEENFFKLIIGT